MIKLLFNKHCDKMFERNKNLCLFGTFITMLKNINKIIKKYVAIIFCL